MGSDADGQRRWLVSLLDDLRKHGFAIGVDDYVTITHLIPAGADDEQARLLIRPLVAKTREQWAQFDERFERHCALRSTGDPLPPAAPAGIRRKRPAHPRRRLTVAMLAVFLLLLLSVMIQPSGGDPTPSGSTGDDPTGSSSTGDDSTGDDSSVSRSSGDGSIGGGSIGGDSIGGDSTGGDSTGGDSTGGDSTGGDSIGDNSGSTGPALVVHHTPTDLIIAPPPTPRPWARYLAYGVMLFAGLTLALHGLVGLALAIRRRRQPVGSGPYSYTPRFTSQAPQLPDRLHLATHIALTTRVDGAAQRQLDIERSIAATVRGGGRPVVVWGRVRRAPVIAVLLEVNVRVRAHADTLEAAFLRLRRAGVQCHVFRFRGSLDRCVSATGARYRRVADLHQRGFDRVVILGDPARVVDVDGAPASWVRDLAGFTSSWWMVPDSLPVPRGAAEALAGAGVELLPADLELLPRLGEAIAPAWRRFVPPPDSSGGLDELHSYLGPAYEILIAAAVIAEPSQPALAWIATRFFPEVEPSDRLRLLNLRWVVENRWPEQLRSQLLELRSDRDSRVRAIDEALLESVDANKPTDGSRAHQLWELQRLELEAATLDPDLRRSVVEDYRRRSLYTADLVAASPILAPDVRWSPLDLGAVARLWMAPMSVAVTILAALSLAGYLMPMINHLLIAAAAVAVLLIGRAPRRAYALRYVVLGAVVVVGLPVAGIWGAGPAAILADAFLARVEWQAFALGMIHGLAVLAVHVSAEQVAPRAQPDWLGQRLAWANVPSKLRAWLGTHDHGTALSSYAFVVLAGVPMTLAMSAGVSVTAGPLAYAVTTILGLGVTDLLRQRAPTQPVEHPTNRWLKITGRGAVMLLGLLWVIDGIAARPGWLEVPSAIHLLTAIAFVTGLTSMLSATATRRWTPFVLDAGVLALVLLCQRDGTELDLFELRNDPELVLLGSDAADERLEQMQTQISDAMGAKYRPILVVAHGDDGLGAVWTGEVLAQLSNPPGVLEQVLGVSATGGAAYGALTWWDVLNDGELGDLEQLRQRLDRPGSSNMLWTVAHPSPFGRVFGPTDPGGALQAGWEAQFDPLSRLVTGRFVPEFWMIFGVVNSANDEFGWIGDERWYVEAARASASRRGLLPPVPTWTTTSTSQPQRISVAAAERARFEFITQTLTRVDQPWPVEGGALAIVIIEFDTSTPLATGQDSPGAVPDELRALADSLCSAGVAIDMFTFRAQGQRDAWTTTPERAEDVRAQWGDDDQQQLAELLAWTQEDGSRCRGPGPAKSKGTLGESSSASDKQASSAMTLAGHSGPVAALAFSPDGSRLTTASEDGTARVWDTSSGNLITTLEGHSGVLAFSPDGTRLATSSVDDTARVWDINSGNLITTLKGDSGRVFAVAFSPDGTRLATSSGTAHLWDIESGKSLATFEPLTTLQGQTVAITAVAFSPDGKRVATSSVNGTTRLWDITSGKPIATGSSLVSVQGLTDSTWAVAFSPDGTRLATGSRNGTARLWDIELGLVPTTFEGHTDAIMAVAFSPDGMHFATASNDNTARLWDAESGNLIESGELITSFEGHTDAVMAVAFSPDGRRLATGSKDNTARLWNLVAEPIPEVKPEIVEIKKPPPCNSAKDCYAKARKQSNTKRRDELYELACEAGERRACKNLVESSRANNQYNEVIPLLDKECRANNYVSCHSLGLLYKSGDGVNKDLAEANRLFERACTHKMTRSCYDLGTSYRLGLEVRVDLVEARRLFGIACDGGYEQACVAAAAHAP